MDLINARKDFDSVYKPTNSNECEYGEKMDLRQNENEISLRSNNANLKAYKVKLEKVTVKVVSFLRDIAEKYACFVCSIYDRTVEWFPIPAEPEYEKTFHGKSVSSINDEDFFRNYRKQRKALICSCFSGPVLIDDVYRREHIERLVFNLSVKQYFVTIPFNFNCEFIEILSDVTTLITVISSKEQNEDLSKTRRFSKTSSFRKPERRSNHPTPVAPEQEFIVFPLHKTDYHKPMFPASNQEPKLSIQESDSSHSVDQRPTLSFERHFRPIAGALNGYTSSSAQSESYLNRNICTNVGSKFANLKRQASGNQQTEVSALQDCARAAPDTRSEVPDRGVTRDKYPRYHNLADRLQTYITHNWDSISKPEPKVLAEWGLFFTGKIDLLRCYACGIGFKDWIKEDDPLSEHVRFSPHCHFLQDELGAEQLQNLLDSLLVIDQTTLTTNNHISDTQRQTSTSEQHKSSTPDTLVSTKPPPFAVHNPRYQTMEARIKSFDNRPTHMLQSPQSFALAGLYYTGKSDICRCFACDFGLNDWKPEDDPIEEHVRYFPECPYIKQVGRRSAPSPMQRNVETAAKAPYQIPVASQEVNTLTKQINGLTMEGSMSNGAPSASNGIMSRRRPYIYQLRTPAARSVLEMGYSREVVIKTIEKLEAQGNKNPCAQDIMELILAYEEEEVGYDMF